MKHIVGKINEFKPGDKKIVSVENKSIVVICTGEHTFHAIKNQCPHQGAELGKGIVTGTTKGSQVGEVIFDRENEIIRCPWHGFEYDAITGCSMYQNDKTKIKTYNVEKENENIVLEL